jgi:hypothetical protein
MKNGSKFNKEMERYYDKQKGRYSDRVDGSKSYDSNMYVDDNGRHIIELSYDGKVRFKAEYELIGMYNVANSMWYWGWAIDLIDKSLVESSRKMLDFPKFIKENYSMFTSEEADDLYFKTSTANFYTDQKNIEKILKLTLFQLKADWFITVCHGRDDTKKTCEVKTNDPSQFRTEYLLIKKLLTLG